MNQISRKLVALTLLGFLSGAAAAENWKSWTVSPAKKTAGMQIQVKDGLLLAENQRSNAKSKYNELAVTRTLALKPGQKYVLNATVEAENPGEIAIVYKHHNPYRSLGLGFSRQLVPGENRLVTTFTAKECPAGKTPLVTIAFGRCSGKVTVKHFDVTPYSDKPLPVSLISDDWQAEFKGVTKPLKAKKGKVDLRKAFGKQPSGTEGFLTCSFQSDQCGTIRLGYSGDYWTEIFANGKKVYSTIDRGNQGPQSIKTHTVKLPVVAGSNTLKIRVLAGSGGWGILYGEAEKFIVPEQTENWWSPGVPLKTTIVKDSALDLSKLVPADRSNTRIVYSPSIGAYAFEDDLKTPIHLFGAESQPGEIFFGRICITSEEQAKRELDIWARSLKRRGYSCVRMHTLDGCLCIQSKKDMEVDPKAFDRIMYAFSRLKKEGIRLQLCLLAYALHGTNATRQQIFNDRNLHKIGFMFQNEYECERFRFSAEKLLLSKNPYTGTRLIDDPMLVDIELYNEMETGGDNVSGNYYWNRKKLFVPIRKKIDAAWRDFLKRKGLTYRPIPKIAKDKTDPSPDVALFCEFHAEQLDRAYRWGEKVLRDMGWRGSCLLNSCEKRIGYGVSRWRTSNTTAGHGYFGHPSRFCNSGSQNYQRSSIEGFAEQFRGINSMRLYGHAFVVGEYNHAFWNRYVHEGGLAFPAFAAFQGHQIIAHFANPCRMQSRLFYPHSSFDVSSSPVMMANGFLGAVLFGRGDVKPARHQGVLNIPASYWKHGNHVVFPINSEQSKVALMTGLSLAFPDDRPATGVSFPGKPDFTMLPANHGYTNVLEWTSNLLDRNDGSFDLAGYAAKLKKDGILPVGNLSDPAKGIFQTDTGEIILNGPAKKMTVITPKTEAITWTMKSVEKLDKLTVFPGKGHATVAVSAVDGKTLADSSRIVLIYSTEVINTGMELSPDWTKLFSAGKQPILVRAGTCKAELQAKPGNWKLYALGLDGERLEELPLKNVNGKLSIAIDTAKLKKGITPFFELIRQ